ncbi:MAG: cell division protein FtsL [SAR324 cluster bacterium]|nr:cell division protein FtsL [SAR324 cluster bacterium]
MNQIRKLSSLPAALRAGASLMVVVLCALVLTSGALFYLWQRYQFISLGFEVERLRAEKSRLEVEIEPLQMESDYLSRPERIEILARERLGMRPPRPGQVIVLERHGPSVAQSR